MATFSQWARKRPLRRMAWVCGPEPVLAREVAEAYVAGLPDAGKTSLNGRTEEPRFIWDWLLASPPGPRLTIIWGAQGLANLFLLKDLAEDGAELSYTVFVSDEDDFPRVPGTTGRKVLAPYLAVLRDSKDGQLIRCAAPADTEQRAALVASWWPGAGKNLAALILERCGDSLAMAHQACDKAVRAGMEPTEMAARMVATVEPSIAFADALVAGDRTAAFAALKSSEPGDIGPALGLLASRLAALAQLHGHSATTPDDYVRRLLRPHAGRYDSTRVRHCRELLASAEAAWKSGAYAGVMEAVAAQW